MVINNLWVFNRNKLRILSALYGCKGTLCGCDLVKKLGIPKNLLSHHLRTLKDHHLVTETKCGRHRQYYLPPESLIKIKNILTVVELIKN